MFETGSVGVVETQLFFFYALRTWVRNSIDPDQMLQNMVSVQDLHCLPLIMLLDDWHSVKCGI